MKDREISKPLPSVTALTRPFWEAAAQRRLVMPRCLDCRSYVWTPRPSCYECGNERLEWVQVSGNGMVYSFTVIRQVAGRGSSRAFEKDIPYVVSWVDLDEGPRIVSNIIDCPVDAVTIGMRVTVEFTQASSEIWLPKFRPAAP